MPRAKSTPKSQLVVYMSPEQKAWLEAKTAQLQMGQSEYMCSLIEEKRAEEKLSKPTKKH